MMKFSWLPAAHHHEIEDAYLDMDALLCTSYSSQQPYAPRVNPKTLDFAHLECFYAPAKIIVPASQFIGIRPKAHLAPSISPNATVLYHTSYVPTDRDEQTTRIP
ncbi:hypothetical protein PM082_009094 [Marasmius tenuissimus]|nr:hypothetical protein PM082_009094 [Marasmius tenuissimus]